MDSVEAAQIIGAVNFLRQHGLLREYGAAFECYREGLIHFPVGPRLVAEGRKVLSEKAMDDIHTEIIEKVGADEHRLTLFCINASKIHEARIVLGIIKEKPHA